MRQLTAVNRTVNALALGPEATALIELARGIAREIDAAGGTAPASLWKELRGALNDLGELGAAPNDKFDALLTSLRDASADRETNSRT